MTPTATLDRKARTEVDPRIQARREQVERGRHRRFRRRLLWAMIVLSVGCLVWLLTRSPALDVDHLEVHGSARTSADAVREAAAVDLGDQLLDVDAGAVRERVRSLPWVTDAAVRVHWNGLVEVFVFESEPVAVVGHAGGAMLVDAEGRVLEDGASEHVGVGLDLVRVEGLAPADPGSYVDDPNGALRVAASLGPSLRTRVAAVIATPAGNLDLRIRPRGMVWLGRAEDLPAQLRALTTTFAQVDDTDVEVYDLRVPDQVVITRMPPLLPVAGGAAAPGGPEGGAGG